MQQNNEILNYYFLNYLIMKEKCKVGKAVKREQNVDKKPEIDNLKEKTYIIDIFA